MYRSCVISASRKYCQLQTDREFIRDALHLQYILNCIGCLHFDNSIVNHEDISYIDVMAMWRAQQNQGTTVESLYLDKEKSIANQEIPTLLLNSFTLLHIILF